MAPQRRNHRIPTEIDADRLALQLLENLTDYNPSNPAYSIETLKMLEAMLIQATRAEAQARAALEAARERASAAAWAFHEAMQGAKVQVQAQYGTDSLALHAVGLKRRSERKRPTRRVPPSD
ncbi:MAG: hypothetical protein HGA45_16820 [Chloroflexales bacterium]|nr:hypothetical protein [Chloroflexales bacterium]